MSPFFSINHYLIRLSEQVLPFEYFSNHIYVLRKMGKKVRIQMFFKIPCSTFSCLTIIVGCLNKIKKILHEGQLKISDKEECKILVARWINKNAYETCMIKLPLPPYNILYLRSQNISLSQFHFPWFVWYKCIAYSYYSRSKYKTHK